MAEAEDDGHLLVSSHQLPDPPYFELMREEDPELVEGTAGLCFNAIITSCNYQVQDRLIPDTLSFCPHFKEIISDNLTTYCSLT